MSDQKLFEELVRVASENPGVVQDALLPVLQDYKKSAMYGDPRYPVEWSFQRGKPYMRTLRKLLDELASFYAYEDNEGSDLSDNTLRAVGKAISSLEDALGFLIQADSKMGRRASQKVTAGKGQMAVKLSGKIGDAVNRIFYGASELKKLTGVLRSRFSPRGQFEIGSPEAKWIDAVSNLFNYAKEIEEMASEAGEDWKELDRSTLFVVE